MSKSEKKDITPELTNPVMPQKELPMPSYQYQTASIRSFSFTHGAASNSVQKEIPKLSLQNLKPA